MLVISTLGICGGVIIAIFAVSKAYKSIVSNKNKTEDEENLTDIQWITNLCSTAKPKIMPLKLCSPLTPKGISNLSKKRCFLFPNLSSPTKENELFRFRLPSEPTLPSPSNGQPNGLLLATYNPISNQTDMKFIPKKEKDESPISPISTSWEYSSFMSSGNNSSGGYSRSINGCTTLSSEPSSTNSSFCDEGFGKDMKTPMTPYSINTMSVIPSTGNTLTSLNHSMVTCLPKKYHMNLVYEKNNSMLLTDLDKNHTLKNATRHLPMIKTLVIKKPNTRGKCPLNSVSTNAKSCLSPNNSMRHLKTRRYRNNSHPQKEKLKRIGKQIAISPSNSVNPFQDQDNRLGKRCKCHETTNPMKNKIIPNKLTMDKTTLKYPNIHKVFAYLSLHYDEKANVFAINYPKLIVEIDPRFFQHSPMSLDEYGIQLTTLLYYNGNNINAMNEVDDKYIPVLNENRSKCIYHVGPVFGYTSFNECIKVITINDTQNFDWSYSKLPQFLEIRMEQKLLVKPNFSEATTPNAWKLTLDLEPLMNLIRDQTVDICKEMQIIPDETGH